MLKSALKIAAGVVVGDVTVGLSRAWIKAGPNGIGEAYGLFGVYTVARGSAKKFI